MNWIPYAKRAFVLLYGSATVGVGLYIGLSSSSPHGWWQAGTAALCSAIVATIVPVVWGFFGYAALHCPGDWFDSSEELAQFKTRLMANYSRIRGTLIYWKSKAAAHQRLYFSQILWAILTGISLPVLIQYFDKTSLWPTLFLTVLTTWNGILLVLAYTLHSRELYRGFRQQESDFYDESRRLLSEAMHDDPDLSNKVDDYIKTVASIRRVGRRVETATAPSAIGR